MTKRYDLAIIGGGCAGLSLARDLIKGAGTQFNVPRTIIIEPRNEYVNDRTWCFWAQNNDNNQHLVSNHWQQWTFSAGDKSIVHTAEESWSYCCIPAINFYRDAIDIISQNDQATLKKDTRVERIQAYNKDFLINTSNGDLLANKVIDTRPSSSADNEQAILLQVFEGAEIETDQKLNQADQVGLMQDMAADQFGFKFNYIIPFQKNRVLVESTRFCPDQSAIKQLTNDLDLALRRYFPSGQYRVLRRERGIIPMGLDPVRQALLPNWVRVGSGGGAIRASTGYAYKRIQNWSRLCARALLKHKKILPHPQDPTSQSLMDQLFLKVIRNHPGLAPDLFLSLAQKVEPTALVRFLSDQPTSRDLWSVIFALPAGPFIKQLSTNLIRHGEDQKGSLHRG
ncbi:MAG: lycopene cyclase family protein [Gammaproteobacteria bacterium]|nr:lycopene cyclase family protein [Gammaproteobacteria bacterium]